jgi:hypothetical protein
MARKLRCWKTSLNEQRILSGEKYWFWSSSLCNFLHPTVTSSLLGPDIPHGTLFWNTPDVLRSGWDAKFDTVHQVVALY